MAGAQFTVGNAMTKKKNRLATLFGFYFCFAVIFFSRGLKPVFNADAQTATRQQQQRRQRLATTSLTTKQKKKTAENRKKTQQQKQIDNNVEVKIYKFCLRCRFFFRFISRKKYRLTRETVSLLHLSLSLSLSSSAANWLID